MWSSIDNTYKELVGILPYSKSELVFAELNKSVFIKNNLVGQVNELQDNRIKLFNADVWEVLRSRNRKPVSIKQKFVLFDFDFCNNITYLIENTKLYHNLNWLSKSKLLRKSGFWLFLVYNTRNYNVYDRVWAPAKIEEIFLDNGWIADTKCSESYTEGQKGANMVMMSIRFHKNYA